MQEEKDNVIVIEDSPKAWNPREYDDKKELTIIKPEYPLLIPSKGTLWRNNKKVGRNSPCFCGSGKKYKNCCGKWDRA